MKTILQSLVSGIFALLMPLGAQAQTSAAPILTTQPASQSVAVGASVTFTVAATATPSPNYQWFKDGVPLFQSGNSGTLTISSVQFRDAGVYSVQVFNSAGSVTSEPATLSVASQAVVTTAPVSQSVSEGADVSFSVATTGSGLTYQWLYNDRPLDNATGDTLTLDNVGVNQAGAYSVEVSGSDGVEAVEVAALAVSSDASLTNLSVRSSVGTKGQPLVIGFVLRGTGTGQLLVRGVGPTLSEFGVSGVLASPELTLYGAFGQVIASNSGWDDSATLSSAFAEVGAFPFEAGSADTALLETLGPGNYTATVTGIGSSTGTALGELYSVDSGTPTVNLVNVSGRGYVSDGGPLIAGFVVSGTTSETVLIRGVGPGLGVLFGIPGALRASEVTLYNSQGVAIASNSGWNNDPMISSTGAQVGAFAFPDGSLDSALVVTIPPGVYTAEVTGQNGASGVALAEVYKVK
jgi:hypothetical protein